VIVMYVKFGFNSSHSSAVKLVYVRYWVILSFSGAVKGQPEGHLWRSRCIICLDGITL